MIIWGGLRLSVPVGMLGDGAQYDPVADQWTSISFIGAPTPRMQFAAVWTGTEMIFWGGNRIYPGAAMLGDGARYNPTTNTWSPISAVGTPAGRFQATAVWTGTEMIVWGGSDGSAMLNSGARYNPSTDTWQTVSSVNAPEGRRYHSAVWTGNRMIVWGGRDENPYSILLNTGAAYDPLTDTWATLPLTDAPAPRYNHTANWTGTEMIVWGGKANIAGAFVFTNSGGRFNPSTGTWQATTSTCAIPARTQHTTVWSGTELLIWGGDAVYAPVLGGKFDSLAGYWTPMTITNQPQLRYNATAVWTK